MNDQHLLRLTGRINSGSRVHTEPWRQSHRYEQTHVDDLGEKTEIERSGQRDISITSVLKKIKEVDGKGYRKQNKTKKSPGALWR